MVSRSVDRWPVRMADVLPWCIRISLFDRTVIALGVGDGYLRTLTVRSLATVIVIIARISARRLISVETSVVCVVTIRLYGDSPWLATVERFALLLITAERRLVIVSHCIGIRMGWASLGDPVGQYDVACDWVSTLIRGRLLILGLVSAVHGPYDLSNYRF